MSGKSKATASQLANQLPGNQNAVNAPVLPCAARRDPQLKVKVFARVKGKKVPVASSVSASALSQASAAGDGLADFGYVLPGTYDVKADAILAPHDDDYYSTGEAQRVTLASGDKRTLNLEVKPRNVITPKVEVEYKVVLFEPDLAQHEIDAHDPPASELRPQPTRVEVSLRCSESEPVYMGEGTIDAPNCEVFLDEACQQPLGPRKLTNAELTAASAMKLYLRGTGRGLFTLKLSLDADPDPRFKVEPPATEDMGVVAPRLIVHQHVTAVAIDAATYPLTGYCADLEDEDLIPDQLPLSDADKVQKGRLLHKQSKMHHGRARALLHLEAAEWPAGTDDYQIVLACTGSALRAYDEEKDGKKQSLPLKTKVADLKAADKELWIEGASTSAAARDIRLSVGLDRSSGGLSKSAKTNADWTRFTVVNIESVKLFYTDPPSGEPKPWNAAKKIWYINYEAGDAGRTVKIRARLSKPIAGVRLHFMLSPDKDNLKEKNWGIDLPATWGWGGVAPDVKHKDKLNATDLLHKWEDTDADGQADCELVLSQFGGDRFVPGAYITQDPHLAAYVHGHDDLAERKPKLASDAIKVWRKFAYQKIKVRGLHTYPSTTKAEDVYGRVRAKMFKVPSVYVDKAVAKAWPEASILPEYMFKVGGSKTKKKLNISDANQHRYFALVNPDPEHPIKVPIVTCDYNWAEEGASGIVSNFNAARAGFPLDVTTNMHACDPPVQGGPLLAAGNWTAAEPDPAGGWLNVWNGALQDGDVDINPDRDNINKVRVHLPAGVDPAATHVWITGLRINGARNHYLGGYDISPVCPQTIVAVYDPTNKGDYQNTVVHELGHAFHQTGGVAPAAGIPVNPGFIQNPTGPHCTYNTNKCVMFTSGPIAGSLNRYCPDCHPYMLLQDMSDIA
jgi:hypothetical protein